MGFLDWLNNPYSSFAHSLPGNDKGLIQRGTYRIAPGPHGVPMVQLDLQFKRKLTPVANPDMTLCVILDNSGSMAETYAEGHAYDVCATVLNRVSQAGVGFDMVFYNSSPSFVGHIATTGDLRKAIANNQPGGGTTVTAAIRGAIQRYKKNKGIYLIIITDGEFNDKVEVERYLTNELLPLITPENPYALRIHFVGAGHGVDHEFLHRMEDLATGKGVPLVAAHHHAHMSHAHDDVVDELEGAFLGIGKGVLLGTLAGVAKGKVPETHDEHAVIMRVGDCTTRSWHDGEVGRIGFLPKIVTLGLEFGPHHPPKLDLGLRMHDGHGADQLLNFRVSLPRQAPADGVVKVGGWLQRLMSGGATPEQIAAKAELAHLQAENDLASARRQAADINALSKGGIPVQARERLAKLGANAEVEGATFTSNLSPDEMALLRSNGYKARGIVMGSAMYHVGQAYASSQGDCEVTVLSQAYNHATKLAVDRLKQELKLVGAHGVIGVRLAMARHEWGEHSVEVQVMGTAIEGPGKAPEHPWVSDLSGQEWWALHRAGYEPAALVWGHCTWFCLTTLVDEITEKGWSNTEIPHWSNAIKEARDRAMAHVRQQAESIHAQGVTGVRIERRLDEVKLAGSGDEVYNREHHNLVLSITGTAIRVRPDAPRSIPQTRLVLSLRDGALASTHMAASSNVALEEEL